MLRDKIKNNSNQPGLNRQTHYFINEIVITS
jgi:hypothetical protein